MADDDIVVPVIVDDATGGDITVTTDGSVTKIESTDPIEDLKAQAAALRQERDASENARQAAEQRAREAAGAAERARQEASEARERAGSSEAETIAQGIKAEEAESATALRDYTAAMETGNFAEAAKAQQRMARAEGRIARLDEARSEIEARAQAQPRTEQPRREAPTQPTQPADRVDALIAKCSAPTAAWFAAHRDWAAAMADPTPSQKGYRLTAAHNDALANGVALDTPEYFAHVERYIGLKTETKTATTTRRTSSVPAAPVSQSGGSSSNGGGGGNAREVHLSKYEAKAATDGTHTWTESDLRAGRIKDKGQVGQPIGVSEFARRKFLMKQDGRYDRSQYEG